MEELGPLHSVVLYDQSSGHIVHTHYQMTLNGAPAHDKTVVEKEAIESASRHHKNAAELGVLHAGELKPDISYTVDVQKRILIEKPLAKH